MEELVANTKNALEKAHAHKDYDHFYTEEDICLDEFYAYWKDQGVRKDRDYLWSDWPKQSREMIETIDKQKRTMINVEEWLKQVEGLKLGEKDVSHTQSCNGGYLEYNIKYQITYKDYPGELHVDQTVEYKNGNFRAWGLTVEARFLPEPVEEEDEDDDE